MCQQLARVPLGEGDHHLAHTDISTTLTLAQRERKQVVVVGTDTDLLAMLLSQSFSDMDICMLCHRNPLQLYNIGKLQSAAGDMKQHLMCIMHLVDVTLYRRHTSKAKRELLKCYVAIVTRTL